MKDAKVGVNYSENNLFQDVQRLPKIQFGNVQEKLKQGQAQDIIANFIPKVKVLQKHESLQDIFTQMKSKRAYQNYNNNNQDMFDRMKSKQHVQKNDQNKLSLDYRELNKRNIQEVQNQINQYQNDFSHRNKLNSKDTVSPTWNAIINKNDKDDIVDLSSSKSNIEENNVLQQSSKRTIQSKIDQFLCKKVPPKLAEVKQIERRQKEKEVLQQKQMEANKQKKREILEWKKQQQLHDKKLQEVLKNCDDLNVINLLEKNGQDYNPYWQGLTFQSMNQKQLQEKIDSKFNVNFLLEQDVKPILDNSCIQKYYIQDKFQNLQQYCYQLTKTHEDELRSYVQQQLNSNEKLKQIQVECVLNFLQRTNKRGAQFIIKFENQIINKNQELFTELSKGMAFIQVQINDQIFSGINYRDNKDQGSYVFEFNEKILKILTDKHEIKSNCRFITNLKSCAREIKCLNGLLYTNCSLVYSILQPYHSHFVVNKNQQAIYSNSLNPSQQQAINLALDKQPIVLIQGPPGTGKSFTVINIVKQIIKKNKSQNKILICTASNCALDNLLMRLAKEFKVKKVEDCNQDLKMIRMGVIQENTPSVVLQFSINHIILKNYESKTQIQLQKQLEELNEKHKKLFKEYKKMKKKDDKQLRELERQILFTKLAIKKDFKEIKKNIVSESKIVLSTLNSSAIDILQSLYNQLDFLIIDEATQATEVQNLIPWRYNPSKVILVGDPKQLPATTFHPLSDELKINRSMFERLQILNFPLQMLDTQYRMVQNLCKFSSKHFYENKLQTAENLKNNNVIPYQLQNYLEQKYNGKNFVFKQIDGQVSKSNNSYYNREEIEFITDLSRELFNQGCTEIGIITPYQEQVKRIRAVLREDNLNDVIEVNTVDGYQGREKNIILMSCVRSKENGIGFLKDPRRLNVALTRAKYAVFIIGDKKTLKKDKLWRRLIKRIKKNEAIFQLINLQWVKLLVMKNRECIIFFHQKKLINYTKDSVNQIKIKKVRLISKNFMIYLLQHKIHLLNEQ